MKSIFKTEECGEASWRNRDFIAISPKGCEVTTSQRDASVRYSMNSSNNSCEWLKEQNLISEQI